jgi:enoyl-CoA hydratase/carnithine racemase
MAYQFIHVDEQDGILVITMDDPKTRNAIGIEMWEEITKELDRLENDPNLRCLLLTGKDPAFCSGANVRGMARSIEQHEESGEKKELSEKPWDALSQRLTDPTYQEESVQGVRSLPSQWLCDGAGSWHRALMRRSVCLGEGEFL